MRRWQTTAVGGQSGERRGCTAAVNCDSRGPGVHSGEEREAAVTHSGHSGGETAAVTHNRHLQVGRGARLGLG